MKNRFLLILFTVMLSLVGCGPKIGETILILPTSIDSISSCSLVRSMKVVEMGYIELKDTCGVSEGAGYLFLAFVDDTFMRVESHKGENGLIHFYGPDAYLKRYPRSRLPLKSRHLNKFIRETVEIRALLPK